jgi:hypothetical protein
VDARGIIGRKQDDGDDRDSASGVRDVADEARPSPTVDPGRSGEVAVYSPAHNGDNPALAGLAHLLRAAGISPEQAITVLSRDVAPVVVEEEAPRRIAAEVLDAVESGLVEAFDPDRAKWRDVDRELDELLGGRNSSTDLAALLEKHQIRVSPRQRSVLLYLLSGTPKMVRYAYNWLDLAGREGNGRDFIDLAQAMVPTFGRDDKGRDGPIAGA